MKNSILLIILSLVVTFVAAQDAISPFVGTSHGYQVEKHTGNDYEWQVYQELVPLTPAHPADYQFLSSNTSSSVNVQWLAEGVYFLMVRESDPAACSNLKALRLEVIPGKHLGLAVLNATTTQCYQEGANDFTVALQFLDDQGSFWTADRFPVEVSFAVNGVPQPSQSVSFMSQQLHLGEAAFSADPTQSTVVAVQLLEATDKQNLTIQAREGQDIQTTTILALPQISFNIKLENVDFGTISEYSVQGPSTYIYHWTLLKPDGTLLNLSSETRTTESIDWNQEGAHELRVQATNQAGCSSQVYSKTIVVLPQADLPVAVIEQESLQTGSCGSIRLDASKSTGVGELMYSWSPASYLDDPQSPTPLFSPGASTRYTLTVTDSRGKTATDAVFVEVMPSPQIVVDRQVFVTNRNDVIMLDASSSTGTELSFNWWSAGDGLLVSGAQTASPEVSGLGKYYLQVTDRFGCTALDSVVVGLLVQVTAVDDNAEVLVNTYADINVLRNDAPKGQLDPQSITIVAPPEHGFANITSDSIITYTPDRYYVGSDEFIYAVCDYSNECDEANVLVRISDEALFVPNAFSPNGDGLNDYFEILGIGGYERVSLKIFNRWGNLIYESKNYGLGGDGFWDGKASKGIRLSDGQVPTGTYYYILNLGRGKEKVSGFIYLDR